MAVTSVNVAGMHCASCKTLIEEVAMETPGVRSCAADLEKGTGTVEHDDAFDFEAFVREIAALGPYRVTKV